MTYRIKYTQRAEADLRETYLWWRVHRSSQQASRWLNEIFPAIDVLKEAPDRFPHAPETDLHPQGLRQLLFGVGHSITHRVIFTIVDEEVQIIAIRHTARDILDQTDLE